MATYNAVAGATEESFNNLSRQLHAQIYPNAPLKGELEVTEPLKIKATYDLAQAFVFRFKNSALVAEYKAGLLASWTQPQAEQAGAAAVAELLQGTDVTSLIDGMVDSRASFDVLANKVILGVSINGRPERRFEGSVSIGAVAQFTPDWRLVPQALTARVQLTGKPDPELERLVNDYLVPLLLPKVNEYLGKGFELPAIRFEGVEFAAPAVRVSQGVVAGYAALKGSTTQAPEGITVRNRKGVFVHFDDAVANGAATSILRHTRQAGQAHGKEEWEPGLGIEGRASFSVGLRSPRFALQDGNKTLASLEAYGSGRAGFRIRAFWKWWDWVRVGLSILARPQVVASVLLSEGWVRFHQFSLTQRLNIDLRFDEVPEFINRLLSRIVDELLSPIANLIVNMIALLKIPVFQLPEITPTIGGVPLRIGLDQTVIDTFTADGKKLCEVAGVAVSVRRAGAASDDVTADKAAVAA